MKKGLLVGLVFGLLLSMTGCGSSSYEMVADTVATESVASNGAAGIKGDYYESPAAEEIAVENGEQTLVESNRKLIKTVHMNVETENFEELIQILQNRIEALGGYIEQFSSHGMESSRFSDITARIPKNQLDSFLETVEGEANITYRQESVEDVTLSYVDLESHKKMLLKEQERLLELLDEAMTIEDIITIEGRLTDVQYQIESMESQLRTYDNQIDYSTVYLSIEEVVRYTPQEPENVWEQIQTGFTENLYSVLDGLKAFFVGLIIHIPTIVLLLIVAGIFAVIIRAVIRTQNKRNAKKQQQKNIQQVYMPGYTTNMTVQNQNKPQENVQKGTEKENE